MTIVFKSTLFLDAVNVVRRLLEEEQRIVAKFEQLRERGAKIDEVLRNGDLGDNPEEMAETIMRHRKESREAMEECSLQLMACRSARADLGNILMVL